MIRVGIGESRLPASVAYTLQDCIKEVKQQIDDLFTVPYGKLFVKEIEEIDESNE